MFSRAYVILSMEVYPSMNWGRHPLGRNPPADTPQAAIPGQIPQVDTPWADTLPGQTQTPRQTPPCPVCVVYTPPEPNPMHAVIQNPLPSACWDAYTPSRHPKQTPPWADTFPGQTPPGRHPLPSACWDTNPYAQCMLGYKPLSPAECVLGYTPPEQCMPGCTPPADTPMGRHPHGQTPPWADTPMGRHPHGQTPPCPVYVGIHTPR